MKMHNITWVSCMAVVILLTSFNTVQAYDKRKLSPIKLYWADRGSKEQVQRIQSLTKLMGLKGPEEKQLYARLEEVRGYDNWFLLNEEQPNILFKISPKYDELKIIDRKLAEDTSGKDIGEQAALEIASKYLENLKRNKLLTSWDYNPKDAQIGQHIIGAGALDGSAKEETTTEYRVTFRANVNGIQLANAGVRIAVHRSGKISGIRMGGVSGNVMDKNVSAQQVSEKQIKAKFGKSIPRGLKPRVVWERVMYVMPEDKREAVVEPMHIVSYSLVGMSDKEEVISRRNTVGISLTDAKATVVNFTPPTKKQETPNVTRDSKKDKAILKKVLEGEKHSH